MFVIASEETYEDGQIIYDEGNHGDWIYEIIEGTVLITKKSGNRYITVTRLQPGDIFGEVSYIADIPRINRAQASGKVIVGVIDRTYLDKEMNKLSGDFRRILKTTALRLKEMTGIAASSLTKE